jgi:hypothetical protein
MKAEACLNAIIIQKNIISRLLSQDRKQFLHINHNSQNKSHIWITELLLTINNEL